MPLSLYRLNILYLSPPPSSCDPSFPLFSGKNEDILGQCINKRQFRYLLLETRDSKVTIKYSTKKNRVVFYSSVCSFKSLLCFMVGMSIFGQTVEEVMASYEGAVPGLGGSVKN